jgi:uncharacterized cofD-like protein
LQEEDIDKIKVVVIGGGTGTVSVLNGLKKYQDLEISVVVSMTDDGGSNKVVRDEFGLLPLSDVRKSIIALAKEGNGKFRDLFTYRFDKGDGLSGHTLGNLILMALSDITGSELGAIASACKIFQVLGEIIPVTLEDTRLVAKYSDGSIVAGEHLIDEPGGFDLKRKIEDIYLQPKVDAFPRVIEVISQADFIVAGPGDLYTSIIANIIVGGVADAIAKSKAKYIYINNLMSKRGQTHAMKASDLVAVISRYSNRVPDIVIQNNQKIPVDILENYKKEEELKIEDDLDNKEYTVVRDNLIGERKIRRESGDTLVRSLVRHDSIKVGEILYRIFKGWL